METSAEPHREQKHRARPGEDSYRATSSVPEVQRNCPGSTIAHVTNAAPCDFLHIEQWQCPVLPNVPAIS